MTPTVFRPSAAKRLGLNSQISNLNSFPSHFPNSHRKYSLIKRCQVILLVNGIDHPVFPYVKIGRQLRDPVVLQKGNPLLLCRRLYAMVHIIHRKVGENRREIQKISGVVKVEALGKCLPVFRTG